MIVVSWLIVSIGYNILSNFSHFFSMVRYEPTERLLFLVLPLIFICSIINLKMKNIEFMLQVDCYYFL